MQVTLINYSYVNDCYIMIYRLARFALDQAHAIIAPGVTTDKIDEIVFYYF